MEASIVPNINDNISQFDELCLSFGDIGKRLTSGASATQAFAEIDLADVDLAKLRGELDMARYACPNIIGGVVGNDYVAMTRIAERAGTSVFNGAVDEKGRIFRLMLFDTRWNIDEISLLSELQVLIVTPTNGYEKGDLSPIVNCSKLTSLGLNDVDSQMPKLEAVLEKMPWLRSVYVSGSQSMGLRWATGHQDLVSLLVPKLGILELAPLSNCVNLRSLNISGNPIRSLAPLLALNRLDELDIRGTLIPDLSILCDLNNGVDLIITPSMTELPGYAECREAIVRKGGELTVQG